MSTKTSTTEELLRDIIQALCAEPKGVRIEEREGIATTFIIQCAQQDYGRVIGAGGKRIKTLGAIFRLIGEHDGTPVVLSLEQPHKGTGIKDPIGMTDEDIVSLLETMLARFWPTGFAIDKVSTEGQLTISVASDGRLLDKYEPLLELIASLFRSIGHSRERNLEVNFF